MANTSADPVNRSDELGKVVEALLHNVTTLVPAVKSLADLGKKYQKAMSECTRMAAAFWEAFNEIAQHASNYRTSTRFIGDSMLEISEVHRQIELQRGDVLRSYMNDFVLPVEAKIESEERALAMLRKSYKEDCELRIQMVESAEEELRSVRKKFRSENPGIPFQDDRESQLIQTLRDRDSDLFDVRSYGLRKALSLERKIHSVVMEKFCLVIKSSIVYHGRSHNGLSRKINDWTSLATESSETQDFDELLKDPTLVPRNKWLEDDSRHFLDGPLPSQQAARAPKPRISQSAENILNRPTSPLHRWGQDEQPNSLNQPRRNRLHNDTNVSAPDVNQPQDYYPFQSSTTLTDGLTFSSPWTQDNSPEHRQQQQQQQQQQQRQQQQQQQQQQRASLSHLSNGIHSLGDLTEQRKYQENPFGFSQAKSTSLEGLGQHHSQFPSTTQLPFQAELTMQPPVSQPPAASQPPMNFVAQPSQAVSQPPTVSHPSQGQPHPPSHAIPSQQSQVASQAPPQLPQVISPPSLSPAHPQGVSQLPQPQQSVPPAQQGVSQLSQPQQIATQPFQAVSQAQPVQVLSQPQFMSQSPTAASVQANDNLLNHQPVQLLQTQTAPSHFQEPQLVSAVPQQPYPVPSLQQSVLMQPQLQPQMTFLQQTSGQPVAVKPKMLSTSLLDTPKFGMKFRALYTFSATTPSQLSFREGDLIDAVGDSKDGWQYGENSRTKRSGWFPANYVEQMVALRDPRVGGPAPQYLRRNHADTTNLRPTIPAPDYKQKTTAFTPGGFPRGIFSSADNVAAVPVTTVAAATVPASQQPRDAQVVPPPQSSSSDIVMPAAATVPDREDANVIDRPPGQLPSAKYMGVQEFE